MGGGSHVRVAALCVVLAACGVERVDDGASDRTIACSPRTPESTDDDVLGFYACVDAQLVDGAGCGEDGYPLGFGGRYGQRYWDGAPTTLSEDGQAWVTRVASCLQVSLLDVIDRDTTCDAVWTLGFGTHDECYVDSGFCALPVADQLWVFSQIDAADRARPEVVAMGQSVIARCEELASP